MFERKEKPFILLPKRDKDSEQKAKTLGQFASWNWMDSVDYDAATTKNATDALVKDSKFAFVIINGLNAFCAEFVALNVKPTKEAFNKFLKDFNAKSYFSARGVMVFTYENGVRTETKKGSLDEVISCME